MLGNPWSGPAFASSFIFCLFGQEPCSTMKRCYLVPAFTLEAEFNIQEKEQWFRLKCK